MFIEYRELSPLHPEQQNSLSMQALWAGIALQLKEGFTD